MAKNIKKRGAVQEKKEIVEKIENKKDSKNPKDNDKMSKLSSKIKNFDIIKKDYELSEEDMTLNGILRKMSETLELYLKIIQQILQPEEFHSLHECNIFEDEEKAALFELYKRIIITHREILKSEIMNDEKDALSTIQYVHEEITSVRSEMVKIVKRLQDSWKIAEKKNSARYFG